MPKYFKVHMKAAAKVFWSIVVCLSLCGPAAASEGSFSPEDLTLFDNCVFLDRDGRLLRFLPDEKGLRRINISQDEIPELVKKAFISIEDRRFYSHGGFDLAAILRALKDNLLAGRVVSGASTISQQTVRLIYPHKRTLGDKITEIFRSARLEGLLDKEEILTQYLNRVPMGNNVVGIELAARTYFGKGVNELVPAEAAVLASLPKAPSFYNPYGRHRENLLKRKDRVLTEMAKEGYLTEEELKEGLKHEISFEKKDAYPFLAPHFTELLLEGEKGCRSAVLTTIDTGTQRAVEGILRSHRARIAARGGTQAAAIVIHNPSMEVLAFAGSFSYSAENKGYNNGVRAFRSAGSTIKPFLYANALEQGYTASSLLEDILRRYKTPLGDYSPDNFDRKEYGPITLRTALGNSLNISAVRMLESLELRPMYDLLKRLNLINYPEEGAEHYGLGLVIGNIEVSLEELVTAYAMLANKGIYRPLRFTLAEEEEAGERIFSEETAYIITDVLSDPSARVLTFGGARELDFPFKVSVKTGTSTKYRDGWAIGYTPEYTAGVWVGDFDGRPTSNITGAWGAGPLLKDIFHLLYGNFMPSQYTVPENVVSAEVCGISGMKPGPSCNYVTKELFIKGTEPKEACSFHQKERYFHELPTNYAGWVFDKASRLPLGSYRLSGFSRDLEELFDSPQDVNEVDDLPGIRIRSSEKGASAPSVHQVLYSTSHVTISRQDESEERKFSGSDAVSITYPLPGDRFLMQDDGEQSIRLESVTSVPMGYVDWFVDGKHYARTRPPYNAYWNLERGSHTIMAVGPNNTGDSIKIIVE
jgi:penicillin-binding protein 1C